MGILSGKPKDEPLHYGEVYDVWQFSMAAKGCISGYRALSYHAGDKDLKEIIGDIINQAELEVKECDEILNSNGIVPHPAHPDRPKAKLEEIPIGARFTDPEIAAMVSADLAAGLITCSQVMGKSIREDVGALFAKYHITKAAIGLKALRLSKEKGWLVPPPLQIKRPDLVEA
ncbi:MAG: rane protein [Paenibacillus sp.]|nr:rane protein [Paenibacillus sp.]